MNKETGGFVSEGMKRFNYLISEIDAVYHEAALRFGLSDSAMHILYTLCNNDGQCLLSDICKCSGISKQTINSAIRKLEAEDIVYLEHFSGKKKMVYLTDKGNEIVKNTVCRLIKKENEIFGSWSEKEQKEYLDLTQRFLNQMKEKVLEI